MCPLCPPQFKAGYDEIHATTTDAVGGACIRGKRCAESSEEVQVSVEGPPLCVGTVVSVCALYLQRASSSSTEDCQHKRNDGQF